MLPRLPLHPLLAALFPVLALWSTNAGYLAASDVLLPGATMVSATLASLLLLGLALRDRHRGALVTTTALALLFSYNHVHGFLTEAVAGGAALARHRYLAPATLVALLAVAVLARRSRRDFRPLTSVLNTILLPIVLVPLATLSYKLVADYRTAPKEESGAPVNSAPDIGRLGLRAPLNAPDIYYIILDAYGRGDVLEKNFQYDNRSFLAALASRGFDIATHSTANYARTPQSLASSFHMEYLDGLTEKLGAGATNVKPLFSHLKNNPVWAGLSACGYKTVAFATGFAFTEFTDADHYFAPSRFELREFSRQLLAMTPLDPVLHRLSGDSELDEHRRRVLYTLEQLPRAAALAGPKFVFAHLVCPHAPFAFDADGNVPNTTLQLDWRRDAGVRARQDRGERISEYIPLYRDQVAFIEKRILLAIDRILQQYASPPIIILQSDHGPGSRLHDWDPERSDLNERFPILNSYLFPGGAGTDLYEGVTPVNSFRIVFNRFFGARLPLLPDRNYFSGWDEPYRFVDVTERITAR